MINGMTNHDYWESLIAFPDDDEQLMLAIAGQMARDGQSELAAEYSERARVAAAHNKILRVISSLNRDNRDHSRQSAGCLIHSGWKPPPGLMLTDEGKKVVAQHHG